MDEIRKYRMGYYGLIILLSILILVVVVFLSFNYGYKIALWNSASEGVAYVNYFNNETNETELRPILLNEISQISINQYRSNICQAWTPENTQEVYNEVCRG